MDRSHWNSNSSGACPLAKREIPGLSARKGDIELVYFDVPQPQSKERNGGLVMSDGRQYSFTYQKGAIIYQEEKND